MDKERKIAREINKLALLELLQVLVISGCDFQHTALT
jgi:hypothetical protein